MSANNSFDSEVDVDETENTTQCAQSEQVQVNKDLLKAISKTLSLVLEENQRMKNFSKKIKEQSNMIFSSKQPPQISLYDYLYRIKYYSEMSDSTVIIALIYIDRFCEITSITLTPYNIHRILFGSILCAIKYNEDVFYENKYYAEIAGVSLKELNKIEYDFIDLIDFNLFITKQQFDQYENYLQICGKKK